MAQKLNRTSTGKVEDHNNDLIPLGGQSRKAASILALSCAAFRLFKEWQMIEFAQIKIEIYEDNVRLVQDVACNEPDIIMFPKHQAKAICQAIMSELAKG